MDWEKFEKVPKDFATAREIGLAAATLGAMARRGLVEVKNTTPKQYRKSNNKVAKILHLCTLNEDDYDTYFTLRKSNEKLGMLCSRNTNGDIVDCWGKLYDLTNVNKIEFRTKSFDI